MIVDLKDFILATNLMTLCQGRAKQAGPKCRFYRKNTFISRLSNHTELSPVNTVNNRTDIPGKSRGREGGLGRTARGQSKRAAKLRGPETGAKADAGNLRGAKTGSKALANTQPLN